MVYIHILLLFTYYNLKENHYWSISKIEVWNRQFSLNSYSKCICILRWSMKNQMLHFLEPFKKCKKAKFLHSFSVEFFFHIHLICLHWNVQKGQENLMKSSTFLYHFTKYSHSVMSSINHLTVDFFLQMLPTWLMLLWHSQLF